MIKKSKGKVVSRFVCGLAVTVAVVVEGGDFRFPAGLSYCSGVYDVMDKLKENHPISSDFTWPVGLALRPYYELDNGVGFGASVGPTAFIVIDRGYAEDFNFVVPVGGFVRYSFMSRKNTSLYVRVGVSYNIVGGDYLGSGTVGGVGAIGVEFFRHSRVGLAIEGGYNSATVTVGAGPLGAEKDATFGEIFFSVMAVF